MTLLITLLILSIIIFIHELGHFLAARVFKMPISEFSIGMGPELLSYKKSYTKYSVRGIPMGGFVNIDGMDIEKPVENGFNSKPAYQRFIVLFAGVFMNFVLAFIIMMSLTFISGKYDIVDDGSIGYISEKAPAYNDLKVGDKIKEIDNIKIENWNDITVIMRNIKKDKLNMVIERDGVLIEKKIKLIYDEKNQKYMIGINPKYIHSKYGFIEGIKEGVKSFNELFSTVFKGLKMLVKGEVKSDEVSGPIGMVRIVDEFVKTGKILLVWLTAMLSVNIGIFNLLPFPALDGGRIIFVILEMIGIKINKKIEERVHLIGMVILILLFFIITGNDIKNIFKK
ncbi:site-2 protease [Hypnocyclicus thermotrophus]|uniref:Zinc metalloprotease n=1 Tax=Hypnocyclicus thermotrophus TaxID=1627895 RepID=A0AA46I5U9_9FUSO|nr:RIP metalloprotease RseP [Hypnocyclicus thermotrophus]TDT70644.1 site-2 protease [Hypnocyclicus thermotrophus]